MKDYIKVAAYITLADVAIGALIVGLVAGEPTDKLRFWLALAVVALGAIAFVSALIGAGIERMDNDGRMDKLRADYDFQIASMQQEFSSRFATQFSAGFDYANQLHAGSVDSVAKAWGVASKRLPHQQVISGAQSFGAMAEISDSDGQEPLEL
jgi:hypothetical protein